MWCSNLCYLFVMLLLKCGQSGGCYCPQMWQPVCASDEQIYSNMCYFMCARGKFPNLVPQPMTFCQQGVPTNQQPIENEGNGNPNAPNEGNGQSPVPSSINPPHETHPYDAAYSPYGPRSPSYGYAPLCHWSCYKAPTHPLNRICDDMGGSYYSDCEYYKGVCRAEMRGLMVRRSPCQRSTVFPPSKRPTWLK